VTLIIKMGGEKKRNEKKTDTFVNKLNKWCFFPLKAEPKMGLKDVLLK